LETLINKLSSIMENEKENVIEKHCSEQLILILKNSGKSFGKSSKKNKKEVNLIEDYDDRSFFINFWNQYKSEIDNVINELNQLYSILLNSVKDITFVFEHPFAKIEEERPNTKINIESFIKDKFLDIICNDDLIKTLIHEIKRNQKSKTIYDITKKKEMNDIDSQANSDEIINIEICHTINNQSTCEDVDNATYNSDVSFDDDGVRNSPLRTLNDLKDSLGANYKDLNELVSYINNDDSCEKNQRSSKKNKKNSNNKASNQTKKKKKTKKTTNSIEKTTKADNIPEEDKLVLEFKMKLESQSVNAKEKQKIRPVFSRRFLNFISSHLAI